MKGQDDIDNKNTQENTDIRDKNYFFFVKKCKRSILKVFMQKWKADF